MPEGPEVRITSQDLNKKFKGATITGFRTISGRYTKKSPKNLEEFRKKIPLKITEISNKGKFIYILLHNDSSIWITLGLTGYLTNDMEMGDEKHLRYLIETNKGPIYFYDQRNFGTIIFSNDRKELDKKLTTLGPDLLQTNITWQELKTILMKSQNKPVAVVLMDQKKLSGIGNYLRAEILYDAKISPFKLVKDMSDVEFKRLLVSIKKEYEKAYKIQTKDGLEYPRYNHFNVYRQKETPRGEKVASSKLGRDGRTIWYVPSVQK
jgi:DNA-formamidopyrimidine glycosylase